MHQALLYALLPIIAIGALSDVEHIVIFMQENVSWSQAVLYASPPLGATFATRTMGLARVVGLNVLL